MTIPLPWLVTVRTLVSAGVDGYGNLTTTPQDRTEPVYGWAPAGTSELDQNNAQVTHDLDLYVPPGFTLAPSDRVRVLDDWYEVEGRLLDFNHGPFGFVPGGVARLRRVTG